MSQAMQDAGQGVDLTVMLRPRDPIIARDGRPFAATPGARAETLPWPLPGTVAGALRTQIGTDRGFDWHGAGPALALGIAVHGPLMLARLPGDPAWRVYVSRPNDALVVRRAGAPRETPAKVYTLRPYDTLPDGAGCDIPPGMHPLRIPDAGKADFTRPYWPLSACVSWLIEATSEGAPEARREPEGALTRMPTDARMHVKIDPTTGASEQGYLFATVGLAFADAPRPPRRTDREVAARALLCRVSGGEAMAWRTQRSADADVFVTLGGERRLVELRVDGVSWPSMPAELRAAVQGTDFLRVMLVTPALFDEGWKRAWLDENLEGSPPGIPELRLRLVAAAVGRKMPVSGWNMQRQRDNEGRWVERGPKAARYAVPDGSVYFFRVIGGTLDAATVGRLWLAPLSDRPQDRTDGYGLAIPGVWSW